MNLALGPGIALSQIHLVLNNIIHSLCSKDSCAASITDLSKAVILNHRAVAQTWAASAPPEGHKTLSVLHLWAARAARLRAAFDHAVMHHSVV